MVIWKAETTPSYYGDPTGTQYILSGSSYPIAPNGALNGIQVYLPPINASNFVGKKITFIFSCQLSISVVNFINHACLAARATDTTGMGQRCPRSLSRTSGRGRSLIRCLRHRSSTSSMARTSATTRGKVSMNPSMVSSLTPKGSETRTLPCVSAPIATRT